jgi:hypothetical protein
MTSDPVGTQPPTSQPSPRAPRKRRGRVGPSTDRRWAYAALAVSLAIALYVSLATDVVFHPTRRVVVFALVALIPTILFSERMTAQFKMEIYGFLITATGVMGGFLGILFLLDWLSKPEEQIAIYTLVDEKGNDLVPFETQVTAKDANLDPTVVREGARLAIVFPSQSPHVRLRVTLPGEDRTYEAQLSYLGARKTMLVRDRTTYLFHPKE